MNDRARQWKLRDVCNLVNGRAYSKSELLAEGKYPVLRVGNFFTNNNWYYSDLELPPEKYCDNGDLLYAWSASFGPRIWAGSKVIFHYHIWKVIPDTALIDQRYLYYFFMWDTERIKLDQGTGTTMIHVAKGSMEERAVPVPSLTEQGRIAALLDEAFEGIATAKANAEKNLQNARELFESHHQLLFSRIAVNSRVARLGELASFRNGVNYTKQSKGHVVRVVGVKDFKNHFWAPLEELDSVTLDGALSESDALKEGDILSVRSNGNPELIGRCILVGQLSEAVAHSGFTIRIRLHGGHVVPEFACQFLKSRAVRRKLVDGGNGSNIRSLNQGSLAALDVPLPSVEVQREVIEEIAVLADETGCLAELASRKVAALDELKQSLLHQAFSGAL